MDDIQKAVLETFHSETQELLTELESALLELEENPEDQELIDRVFRALHTI
ncbi:Hpt domain-containing protein, partial [bacterium]|nr:Hpt domain-containing protein [bacterium]